MIAFTIRYGFPNFCGLEAIVQDDIRNVLSFLFRLLGREQGVALFFKEFQRKLFNIGLVEGGH